MTDQTDRWCCSGNAEGCRLCNTADLPYPWICPGHPDTPENRQQVTMGQIIVSADQIQAFQIAPPPAIELRGDGGGLLVAVHPDGRLEYGPGYEPDEAARRFWDGVEQYARTIQYGAPLNARIDAELKAGQDAIRKVERLDQMATAWLERLPDTIRTATAAEAVHQITRREG